jgi:KDO2-lipid IV(A) lauroyltransferase
MARTIKNNGILGFLIDQDTDVQGDFVTFFSKKAHTPVAPAQFALRTGTPVVTGTIKRCLNNYHKITIESLLTEKKETVLSLTQKMTKMLENRIKKQYSQWVWFHRRWKTKP